jgi:peptidoglycan hydrolase CwlO-like protein|tara:strand:- start:3795 stop:4079 length:285 start_codon:yes stop_codon:yes gene_type:complete
MSDSELELSKAILRLESSIQRMMDGIDVVKNEIQEMATDISKIKDAVYDPDQGIYARLRSLESWKSTSSKITWIMTTAFLGIATLSLWNVVFST